MINLGPVGRHSRDDICLGEVIWPGLRPERRVVLVVVVTARLGRGTTVGSIISVVGSSVLGVLGRGFEAESVGFGGLVLLPVPS